MYQRKFITIILSVLLTARTPVVYATPEPSKWSWQATLAAATAVGAGVSCLLLRNPAIYRYLMPPLECPKQYSIHLMWINRKPSLDQAYVYPSNAENDHGKKYVDTIIKWAKGNQESSVNLWYDGALISQKAVFSTRKHIDDELKKHNLLALSIHLKDIRTTDLVQKKPEFFSPDMPIYWRADFARAIVMKEELERNKESCCIYADFDVEPMAKNKLFDRATLCLLKHHHFVMAHIPNRLQFENGFQMFVHNEDLLKAMQDTIIDANIARAHSFLKEMEEKNQPTYILSHPKIWKIHEASFQENVFYTYPLMHTYLGQLRGLSTLTLPGKSESYDPRNKDIFDVDASILFTKSSALAHIDRFPIPTKKVSVPPSTSKQRELA